MGSRGWCVPTESNGAVAVNIQDQHSKMLDLDFIKSLGQTTLNGNAVPNTSNITLQDTTGFVDGDIIGIFSTTGIIYFGVQLGPPALGVITLDTPIDKAYPSGSIVIRATSNMAVDGSIIPQIFQIGPISGSVPIEIDITRLSGYMQSANVMSDDKFCGRINLPKGIVLRHNNSVIDNKWNAKTNGRLAQICGSDFYYTAKAPAGSYGARFRNSFAGQENHGVTIRLMPSDTLEILIQDDLSAEQVINVMAQGHIVTN